MEMPISYSVCAKIPSDGNIWSNQTRYWANFKKAVRTKRCENHRSTGLFGSYVDTVGRNKKQIQEYIKHQLEEDQIADQMSLREFVDPFTGSKNSKA